MPGRVEACTAVTTSYLAHARVLARALAEHHPAGRLTVVVVDDVGHETDAPAEPFELVRPSELALDAREFHVMAAIYDPVELSCALKPWALRFVLDRGAAAALWLDADTEVFAPIGDLLELAEEHGLVLTPHMVVPRAKPYPDGAYNAGVIATGAGAEQFLSWWAECVRRECVYDHSRWLCRDQRWLDFAPSYFPGHHIMRDPTVNVAGWNLHERQLEWREGGYHVDGKPLRIFHFSGVTPDGLLSEPELREHPVAARLCAEYLERLRAAGLDAQRKSPYGYARSATGLVLTKELRDFLRAAVMRAEQAGIGSIPDPFDPRGADSLSAWLARPAVRRAAALLGAGSYGRVRRALRRAALRGHGRRWDFRSEARRALHEALHELESVTLRRKAQ